jgi:hypothetical protein
LLIFPYVDFRGLDESPPSWRVSITLRQWWPRAAALGAGFAAGSLVLAAYLWTKGSWAEFWHINFEVMPGYARLPLERTEGYWLWALVQTEYVVGSATLAVLIGALIAARHYSELRRLAPLLTAGAIGFFAAAAQVRFHAYYFELAYPFLAMVWGYAGLRVFESFRTLARDCRERGWRVARPLVWLLFANIVAWFAVDLGWMTYSRSEVLLNWWRDHERSYAAYPWPHSLEHLKGEFGVIRFLRAHSSQDDQVFIWGTQPVIYFLSERRAPTRFISNLGLISPWGPPAWREELMGDLRHSPPKFLIVVGKDAIPSVSYTYRDSQRFLEEFPELDGFIKGLYAPQRTIENFVVYRLKTANANP